VAHRPAFSNTGDILISGLGAQLIVRAPVESSWRHGGWFGRGGECGDTFWIELHAKAAAASGPIRDTTKLSSHLAVITYRTSRHQKPTSHVHQLLP
jgi:hypothetical protein